MPHRKHTLFLVDAVEAATLPANFQAGKAFTKTTKVTKSIEAHLANGKTHVLVALHTYWSITCGQDNTVKGKPCDTVYDHFRALDNGVNNWMVILTCTDQGAIMFSMALQKATVANKSMLAKRFPKLSKRLELLNSPYVSFTNGTEDDTEDCGGIVIWQRAYSPSK